MNRWLHWANLLGVAALAVLCVFQWRANRRANLEAAGLEKIRLEQAAKLAEQEQSLKGLAADLDLFREQLGRATESLREAEGKVAALERQARQWAAERDQLKGAEEKWAAAVEARDRQIRELDAQARALAADRNDAVKRFNDLAAKYNAVVQDLNEARARLAGPATNAPPRAP